ncbi:xylulokinase [Lichenibacterium minor]|uniref:Xylulose kinase n=1 Tax=Lichenibacterium minor TaxID=2316528 RepID=A0A4Q2UAZ5_9HYPH|nr:xylulokinase [Lichenibacterium minor]RYC32391.1 xylulokinase [Lichenibacterium minor]
MYLGIDIGTSSVKIVLVDDREAPAASAEVPLGPSRPRPSWSEDDPDRWWDAVATGLDRMRAEHPAVLARTDAIGLSGQMHGALLLDGADRPVRPAILWNDGRAAAQARDLAGRHPELAATAGVRPMPGFTGPLLAWLRGHEPDAVGRARHLLLPKDWVRLKLTGERATDPSDAAGTWLFDQGARAWSPALGAACGADPAWLPRIVESTAVSGTLRADLAARWGMRPGLPVAGGGGDTAVGGVGIGAVEPGTGFVSLGTSGQVFLASDRHAPPADPTVQGFCHALPDRWCRVAALLNGASPLAAAARWTGRPDVATLLAEVEAGFSGPSALLALPYLAGERTPHDDPDARGALLGLTAATTPAEIAQAVMEAVAFSLADGLAALAPARRPAALGFIGGGARSRLWGRMIASVLDVPLERHAGGARGPAFGAARLARLAATGGDARDVAVPPPIADVVAPEARLADAYAPRLEAFRSLYAALKGEFARPA